MDVSKMRLDSASIYDRQKNWLKPKYLQDKIIDTIRKKANSKKKWNFPGFPTTANVLQRRLFYKTKYGYR